MTAIDLSAYVNEAWTVCDFCGSEMRTKETALQGKIFFYKNEEIKMTYFACENCGAVYVIGFENADTFKTLQDVYERRSRYASAVKRNMSERALRRLLKASNKSLEKHKQTYNALQDRLRHLRPLFNNIDDVNAIGDKLDLDEENNTKEGA